MRILIGAPQNADGLRSVAVSIMNADQPVVPPGIFVTEPREGWFALQIPPRELWESHLAVLPNRVRERVESREFYQTLQTTVQQRIARTG